MQVESISHLSGKGWSAPFPSLDSPQTLVLMFGSRELQSSTDLFDQVHAAFPQSVVVGCSTSGEIQGDCIHDGSISLAASRFEHTRLKRAATVVESAAESRAAGESLAQQLMADDLQGVLILSDGLRVNGSQLVEGLTSVLPASVTVAGGLAGDGDRFETTWVLSGQPLSGQIVAVGFYGSRVKLASGSAGGWDEFGPERLVTRSEGSELFELDGKPALQIYKNYLGDQAAGLPASALLFPLSVRANSSDEERYVRTILGINEERQSLTFAGDIPQGSLAQLMHATKDRLIDGAAAAAQSALQGAHEPVLLVSVSCVGRRLVMGQRTEEEIEACLDLAPADVTNVGFYSYGEIAANVRGRRDLHNQTMTMLAISEN